ncbi:MAG: hypothetical protein V4801_28815 [Burkholderia gladioli]
MFVILMIDDWVHPRRNLFCAAHRVEEKHRGGAIAVRHTQREKIFMRYGEAVGIDMNGRYREDEKGFIFQAVFITALSRALPKLCAIAPCKDWPFHTRGLRCEKTDPL